MKKRMVRITGCLLAGALSIGSFGLNTYAAPVAGVSSVTAVEIAEGQTPAAGVSQALAQCLAARSISAQVRRSVDFIVLSPLQIFFSPQT